MPMVFLIKTSGLIFYLNLAVQQIVDVPGNILKFVNISGRLFLIIKKSSKEVCDAKVILGKKFTR